MGLFSNPIKKLTKKPNLKNPKDPLGLMGGNKGSTRPAPKGTQGQGARFQNREERGDQSQAMSRLGQNPGGRNFRKTAVPKPAMRTGGALPPSGNTGVVGPRMSTNTPPSVAGPRRPNLRAPGTPPILPPRVGGMTPMGRKKPGI